MANIGERAVPVCITLPEAEARALAATALHGYEPVNLAELTEAETSGYVKPDHQADGPAWKRGHPGV